PADDLALTDVNLLLGRVQPDRFPFPVNRDAPSRALSRLQASLKEAGFPMTADAVAAGFVEVANANMAEAITQVSVARGVDPRDHVLVGFGGAGGQHVCALARRLGMKRVLLHPLAGLLSAYGIGQAAVTWDGENDAGRELLSEGPVPSRVVDLFERLEEQGRQGLAHATRGALRAERWLDLRYQGTEAPLTLREPGPEVAGEVWLEAFAGEHERRFGYQRPGHPVEVVTARVRVLESSGSRASPADETSVSPLPAPLRRESVYFEVGGRQEAPVYRREDFAPGQMIEGPALILEATGTVVLDPGFRLLVSADGVFDLEDRRGASRTQDVQNLDRADPIRLEVFGNRFMSMAEQMGAVLRNTSVSANIKERLDYSCAVFDRQGGLVANAPHIPVHLGAMGATVRAVQERFPALEAGDAVVTNDPFEGGSHLPDVTLVTPVFLRGALAPDFFVASRGHHADLGGRTPGSMPPDSRRLSEEGVVLPPFRLVESGRFQEERLRRHLVDAPHPARRPDDNVSDLIAMVAANRMGERLLQDFVEEQGQSAVAATMAQLQLAAAGRVAAEIGRLADGQYRFRDQMDDGTRVAVVIEIEGERMHVDFSETGPASEGNLNAPPAVVQAALLYVLRSMIAAPIPLNAGCLDPVRLTIEPGSLLDPPAGSAVVGGNVETSQRIVDVLLGALGLAAASQGTMNNLTFGHAEFGYYETIGGGAGAGPDHAGASGVHTHMTNTRITDPEVLEVRYPVRLETFAFRPGSGGEGRNRGGDGLIRRYQFLAPVTVSLLAERRGIQPWGLAGGAAGSVGRDWIERASGAVEPLPGKSSRSLDVGDVLVIETPGGGGYGPATGDATRSSAATSLTGGTCPRDEAG
ncbi:MAG: hydantoinase B/oxoprolinase family protein, partial [Myxococcota bacterium]|nr:hydantoinase B/oxoprolinase family protein [Myxococcota bacterium]